MVRGIIRIEEWWCKEIGGGKRRKTEENSERRRGENIGVEVESWNGRE